MSEDKKSITIDELFSAGAHYGFSKSRRHPSTIPYIYGSKAGSDIIDLEKTSEQIARVADVVYNYGEQGKKLLVVGTKTEVSRLVQNITETAEMPYVTNRWIGGVITNFTEIKKRLNRLKDLLTERESGELDRKYTKKERVVIGREVDKLHFNFGGIITLDKRPDAILVVDPRYEEIAVTEAQSANIPVIGISGTDTNIRDLDHVIVANDALTTSISLILQTLADAYVAGSKNYTPPARPERSASRPRRGAPSRQ